MVRRQDKPYHLRVRQHLTQDEKGGSTDFEIRLTGDLLLTSANFPGLIAVTSPAGIAGTPINLALGGQATTAGLIMVVTVANLPTGWSLSQGMHNPDGSWSVETSDPSALTVTTPSTFSGAVVLNITESWSNPDGSVGLILSPIMWRRIG